MFRRLRVPRLQAILLWVSALVPYLIFSLAAGTFDRNRFYLLAGLTAVLSFWFTVLPRRPAFDAGFLVVAAAPQITRVFARIYIPPTPFTGIDILGHLAWIHVGILALLVLRDWHPGEFSFWPTSREWRIGLLVFVLLIGPLLGMAEGLRYAQFALPHTVWWRGWGEAVGTFFGILWVVALSEELFFRGFIQLALQKQFRNRIPAILIAASLFGSVHLWVHQFPNWRYAAISALLGVGCGVAFWWAGSVRASMVTHAFVVVTYRLFFR